MARLPIIDNALPGGTSAIHALIIGVGHYTNLLPGLSGAAPSACAFGDWLLRKQRRPGLELGSLDILASQPSGEAVVWQGFDLAAPTLGSVQDAVDAWHARVDDNPGNLAVFYFCGHGIAMGDVQSLLLGDVDPTRQTDPFRNAIAFDEFVMGMRSCSAREQLYVLDACRELPAGFGSWDDDVALGDPLVRFNIAKTRRLPPRRHVVLHATSSTQKAWAGPSGGWFTEALLSVLEGAAGDNRFTSQADEYAVNTRDIADIIRLLVAGDFLAPPAGPQEPVRKGEGDFNLHLPVTPVVPILVTRQLANDNVGARFTALVGSDLVASFDSQDVQPWRARLPVGKYVFCQGADRVEAQVGVPAKRVELP